MKKLIEFFIKYPVGVDTMLIGIFFFGWVSYNALNTTFFPLVESRNITVTAVYPGASPEEMEEGVVNKIEQNLKGLTGVEQYTSTSSENSATISVEVIKGYDTDLVLEDVKNAVESVPSFPTGMEPIRVAKRENLTLAVSMALSGEGVDLVSLKQEARRIERELRLVEGISKISLGGFPDEEIEIAFSDNALKNFKISFQEAANAVKAANIDITGGTLKGEKEELLLRIENYILENNSLMKRFKSLNEDSKKSDFSSEINTEILNDLKKQVAINKTLNVEIENLHEKIFRTQSLPFSHHLSE